MTCDFISFSTVFQSYQDDRGANERLCAIEPCLQLKRSESQVGLKPNTARSVQQRLTY